MSEFAVRRMRIEDVDVVSVIYALANPQSQPESIAKWTRETLTEFPDLCYVAEVDGEVVGGVSGLSRDPNVGVVDDLAVAEEHQGRDIGSALLARVMKEFKRVGSRVVTLAVHHSCSASIPFYYRHEFRISGVAQDYFGVEHDAIMMKKKL